MVVIDPGHQLGNHNFPRQISRLVPAGGFRKPCNTTGTATTAASPRRRSPGGSPELLRDRLRAARRRVVLTRDANSRDRWGPCVDERGRAGNRVGADLKLSIHADGSLRRGARGFHVIAPTDRRPLDRTTSTARRGGSPSTVRAGAARRGLPVANYIAGGDGLDLRGDLGTLNLSDVPTVMVELGNMRNAPTPAG